MSRVTQTVLKLIVEYVTITAPILIYTAIEAVYKDEFFHLIRSPEWSIATIFLTIQTFRTFREDMEESSSHVMSNLLMLGLAGVTLIASINVYIALGNPADQSLSTIITKWALFLVASVGFVYVAGAAIYASETEDA